MIGVILYAAIIYDKIENSYTYVECKHYMRARRIKEDIAICSLR